MPQTPPFDGFTTQPLEALPQSTQGFIASEPDFDITPDMYPVATSRFPNKKKLTRIVAIIILLALCIALYFTWHTSAPTTTTPIISQQTFNGPFTSIDQLQLVVSKTIYNKIKGLITV